MFPRSVASKQNVVNIHKNERKATKDIVYKSLESLGSSSKSEWNS